MAETAPTIMQEMQQKKKENKPYFSLDESVAVMKNILSTHAPDDRQIDVRSLLFVVEDVLLHATPTAAVVEPQVDITERLTNVGELKVFSRDIHKIGCEILSGSRDATAAVEGLFKTLSTYEWHAKAALALAAFAVNYGDFCLTAQSYTTNPLAKFIAVLLQIPEILSLTNNLLKSRLDTINNLIKAMVDLINCIMEFYEFPSQHIMFDDSPSMAMAKTLIPTGVYWIVRGVMACASQFNGILAMNQEYISESWESSTLVHKIGNINEKLKEQLILFHQELEEKKRIQLYQMLVHLFETPQTDNIKVLKVLISSKDDKPLVDGPTKTRVGVEVLRRKTVMLLISDLDIAKEELMVLEQIYNQSRLRKAERPYEVVWLPVVDSLTPWTDEKQNRLEELQSMMPWYSLHHPSLLDPVVIKYIKENWQFEKKAMVVVVNAQGTVTCPNALHMMWIWGIGAFPFTRKREEDLWKDETWRIEFLVDGIDQSILTWIGEEKFICLYGGEDINWIRKFTSTMQRVAQEAQTPLEMVYVGKSNPKERVRNNVRTIETEKLSHYWPELMSIWFFWVRLESMWHSKMQQGRTIDNDAIMRNVTTMLTFDGSEDGWAVIGRGTGEIATAPGVKILDTLTNFDKWKTNIQQEGFIKALTDALALYQSQEHHCARLVLPSITGMFHELSCAECGRPMEKYLFYRCCDE